MTVYAEDVVRLALTQAGDRYVFGGKEPVTDPDPAARNAPFDCSGLLAWATGRLGVPLAGGTWQQLAACEKAGTTIPISQAAATRGAVLWEGPQGIEHVVISLGTGMTIEARGAAFGVGSWGITGRPWTAAARIPGVIYATPPTGPAAAPGKLTVDGDLGPLTVRAMQAALQVTPIDGVLGPVTIRALQVHLRVPADGVIGPVTIAALQHDVQVRPDGVWGQATTRAIQTALNNGLF